MSNPLKITLNPMRVAKDPWSWATHFLGFVAGMVGLIVLLMVSPDDPLKWISASIYGGSMVLLFAASSIYHYYNLGERGNLWLQRIDHIAIFIFIAGSYVPILMHALDGLWRNIVLGYIAALTGIGIIIKALWMRCPAPVAAGMYVALGWALVPVAHIVLPNLSAAQLSWLVVGGLAYTIGAVIFSVERPDPLPGIFGHHEVFHLFVLAGAAAHYVMVFDLLDAPIAPF